MISYRYVSHTTEQQLGPRLKTSLTVKYVPAWFPGAGFKKRIETTRTHIESMKDVPFERVRAERVGHSFIQSSQYNVSQARKKAGTAKPSLIGNLMDEYEASGTLDPEHEYELKLIGAVMYAGKDTCTDFEAKQV